MAAPRKISLIEASKLTGCPAEHLRYAYRHGELSATKNQQGHLILERAEVEAWAKQRPRRRDSLDPKVRWWTTKEIGPLVGLDSLTVLKDIMRGRLPAVYARGDKGRNRYYVAEPELQAWIKRRSEVYTVAPLRGEVMNPNRLNGM